MTYVVDLEKFHGPLDLLLYLIEENQVDIYDIPIAAITDQYMEHLSHTGELNLEQLGDFLIMASYLLYLKSRMLLPRRPDRDGEEEDDRLYIDPREELVQQLLLYKKYRQAAECLAQKQEGVLPRVYYRFQPEEADQEEEIVTDVKALLRAYQVLLRELKLEEPELDLPSGDISVEDKMEEIMSRLQQKRGRLVLQHLFAGVSSNREAMAYFLALLELIRLQLVVAVQKDLFADITVKIRVGKDNVDA